MTYLSDKPSPAVDSKPAASSSTRGLTTDTRREPIAWLSSKLEDTRKQLHHARWELEQLRAEMLDLHQRADQLRGRLRNTEKQLENIHASRAWRLTTRLQSMKRLLPAAYRMPRQAKVDYQLVAQSGLFDSDWYLSRYPDVVGSATDPIVHYLQHGAREGRDPSERFSSEWYCEQYADVAATGINPLIHYLRFGAAEGRKPAPDMVSAVASSTRLHGVFDYLDTSIDRSALPASVAIGVSSLGNFFMTEIARMLEDAFKQLEVRARLFTEDDYHSVAPDECVIIVAPHEFFLLGNGPAALEHFRQYSHLVMLNTEQPQTAWFAEAEKYLPFARIVVDISYQSANYLLDHGYNAFFLPLGYSDYISRTYSGTTLPEHDLFSYMSPAVRETLPQSYSERPIDILFIGTASPRRHEFFARNAAFFAGKNTFIYMPDGDTPFLRSGARTIDFAAFVGLARRSKVLLNIHREEVPYLEWLRIASLGIMQKTLVVTDSSPPGPCLTANQDYLEAPLKDLPSLCERALSDDSKASQAAERAYDKLKATCSLDEIAGKCWTAIAMDLDRK